MFGTINCVYETPCGWCSKWNKKCDRKIGQCKTKDIYKNEVKFKPPQKVDRWT